MAMPLNILERHVNKNVMLTLKDGRTLEGKLTGFDEYMNMILEDTEETKDEQVKRIGTVVLRGNNIVTIIPK
ncbi:MAG: LSM domain-containing protein [Thermoplasmata archaeon]|nr:LSM domain-containing protein [Thermoplasmata archaeon]